MSNVMKIDPRAFSRGVDEVLLLKPVRRAVVSLMHERIGSAGRNSATDGKPTQHPVVRKHRAKHDKSAS